MNDEPYESEAYLEWRNGRQDIDSHDLNTSAWLSSPGGDTIVPMADDDESNESFDNFKLDLRSYGENFDTEEDGAPAAYSYRSDQDDPWTQRGKKEAHSNLMDLAILPDFGMAGLPVPKILTGNPLVTAPPPVSHRLENSLRSTLAKLPKPTGNALLNPGLLARNMGRSTLWRTGMGALAGAGLGPFGLAASIIGPELAEPIYHHPSVSGLPDWEELRKSQAEADEKGEFYVTLPGVDGAPGLIPTLKESSWNAFNIMNSSPQEGGINPLVATGGQPFTLDPMTAASNLVENTVGPYFPQSPAFPVPDYDSIRELFSNLPQGPDFPGYIKSLRDTEDEEYEPWNLRLEGEGSDNIRRFLRNTDRSILNIIDK
jgi:hypothetical protein